ncbi:DUF4386 domain-containing protein [Phycicoccus sp. HDW14]|uniref:DUF4386 domain-containing protein n=1 Tax=Phycicoccus sp. HDW14 TaxID=2714941 RepID=UPI00140CFC4B|nr:DUF4386 domain-containing protein [Phycicoccus sp. HDW14]QIM22061.1 DUF4386 domain-containing protein [Phycicoccus sp. HDW14]
MSTTRRTALVAGLFYLLTFVSIPTLVLYEPARATDFVLGAGGTTGVLWGAFLEVLVGLAGIGTAIALYPVVRRQQEGLALGFVATRSLEAAMIFTGVASLLALVALRHDLGATAGAGADRSALLAIGASHVATYDWAFTLGQSLMPGLNALLLGTLLYRSHLVPRALPLIGLVGAPIHLTAVVLTMFGVVDRVGTVALVAALPIAVWEFSLGVYLVVKGFRETELTPGQAPLAAPPVAVPVG